jgi:hypothetical protein
MNVERLHAITIAVLDDLKKTATESTLSSLVSALQNQINQPQQPDFQKQVSTNLQQLEDVLSSAPSNDFSPAWKQTLKELSISNILGDNLRIRIKDIFERNQITPSVAHQELNEILQEISNCQSSFTQLVSALEKLKIGAEELEAGKCEIGVLLPRIAVQNKLSEFADELKELNGIFNTFSELTTGKRPGFEIRSISSSDFNVFLDMLPITVASAAITIERIIAIYKNILDIRKHHGALKEIGLPDKSLKGVIDYASSIMKEKIEEIVAELLEKYYKQDDGGRRNELATELRFALNKIASRIDKGYSVEVRVNPVPEGEEDESKRKAASKESEHIKSIQSVSKNLEFIKLEGESILSLPESKEEEK